MNGFKHYLRLLTLFIKISLMRQMAYRPHFFIMIVGKVIRIGLLFFFFQAIFLKVDRIGHWTYDQVLLLFATFHIIDYLMSITFHRTLAFQLPQLIQSGQLDSRMMFPTNLLFFVSFESIQLIDFFSFLPTLGLLAYVLFRLNFSFSVMQAFVYVLLLTNALIFLFSVVLVIATLSFWTTQSTGLAKIFDNLFKIGRYPLDIFGDFWRVVFIYFLPLVLIAQLPSEALLRSPTAEFVFFAISVTAISLITALKFWKWGLRSYSSTST